MSRKQGPVINGVDAISLEPWFREHNIDEIEAVIPDMNGVARGKVIPAQKYREDIAMRLPESIFMQTITGDYPDDDTAIDPAEIDMVLRPDLGSLRLVPWTPEPTALALIGLGGLVLALRRRRAR